MAELGALSRRCTGHIRLGLIVTVIARQSRRVRTRVHDDDNDSLAYFGVYFMAQYD